MSDKIEITGTVHTVLDMQQFPSGFQKRVLVINTGGEYPQYIPVEYTKEKALILTGLRKGQQVTASVNLRGNEYNGKYFASIQGWKLDKGEGGQDSTPANRAQSQHNQSKANGYQPPQTSAMDDDEFGEIPF